MYYILMYSSWTLHDVCSVSLHAIIFDQIDINYHMLHGSDRQTLAATETSWSVLLTRLVLSLDNWHELVLMSWDYNTINHLLLLLLLWSCEMKSVLLEICTAEFECYARCNKFITVVKCHLWLFFPCTLNETKVWYYIQWNLHGLSKRNHSVHSYIATTLSESCSCYFIIKIYIS